MALLQFMSAGMDRCAVPASIHCDHLIQAVDGAELDLKVRFSADLHVEVGLMPASAAVHRYEPRGIRFLGKRCAQVRYRVLATWLRNNTSNRTGKLRRTWYAHVGRLTLFAWVLLLTSLTGSGQVGYSTLAATTYSCNDQIRIRPMQGALVCWPLVWVVPTRWTL